MFLSLFLEHPLVSLILLGSMLIALMALTLTEAVRLFRYKKSLDALQKDILTLNE